MIKCNQGYEIEHSMMIWFKGKPSSWDCVDFQTKKSLYEVKSCALILNCGCGKNKRGNKRIITTMLGRFFIKVRNHELLKLMAQKENKQAKYVFVIHVGKQKIWKTMTWEIVDKLLKKDKNIYPLHIKDVFKKELELK